MVMKREVNSSNPSGVKCFSTHLSFECNSSDSSRFMFLDFFNWIFNFQISRIGLFGTVLLTVCSYSSFSSLYHFSFVLAPAFVIVILIFSVVKKLNYFSFFLDFRHFFGLQLISFNRRLLLRVCWKAVSIISTYYYLLKFFGLGFVFKRFFAFEFHSVACVFSMILLIFELV